MRLHISSLGQVSPLVAVAMGLLLLTGCYQSVGGDAEVQLAAVLEGEEQIESREIQQPRNLRPIGSGVTAPRVAAQPSTKAAVKPAEKADKKQHEPLFVNWPEPQLVLLVTGQQQGYIEPCGCTGLANQKGGLARRHTFAKQLADKGWPVVALDVGNQVRRFGRQQEIKFQMTVDGLKKIGYQAVTFGPEDLRLSVGELVAATAADDPADSLFVCANVSVLDESLTPKFRVIKAGGKTIGITAVLGDEERKRVLSDEVIQVPAAEGLKAAWAKLAAAKCDLYVLLAQASLEESAELAKKFPGFDVVVTGGGAGEPTYQAEKIPGTKAVMVQVGTKGMYTGVIGLFADPKQKLRYQRVPLDDRFRDSPDMLQLLASYQDQLETAGLEGLGLKPLPHTSGHAFVGSKACADCHTKAFEVWEKTSHAQATDSLVHPKERTDIARHFDPECLSCHVTGWNAQKFFPFASGYESLEKSVAMHGSGCENCHGPGSAHVAAENGDAKLSKEKVEKLRAAMRLPLAEAERKCIECHDHDNSPDFHVRGAFEKYWEKVKHTGKD